MATRTATPAALLDAAVRVILRGGLSSLTLDAVAREAGVSKGGLLYHFASKDDLVRGMVSHFLTQQGADIEARVAADPSPRRRLVRAYVESTVEPVAPDGISAGQARRLNVALLAAVANNPTLLAESADELAGCLVAVAADDGGSVDDAILALAADGLWLWDLLGLLPADGALRAGIVARMRDMTRTEPTS